MRQPLDPRHSLEKTLKTIAQQVWDINQLSVELEKSIEKLRTLTEKVDRSLNQNRKNSRSIRICHYSPLTLPRIIQKRDGSFILKTKRMNLL